MPDKETRRLDERITAVEQVANKADERSAQVLQGFPQEYLTRVDADRDFERAEKITDALGERIVRIVTDHVSRSEFDSLRDDVRESSGARTTVVATAGIIVTVFIVLLGYSINNRITSADVSNQIQNEAPWNKDGPEIRRRLLALEVKTSDLQTQIQTLNARLNAHLTLDAVKGKP